VLFVGSLFLLLFDNAAVRLEAFRNDLRVEVYLDRDVPPEQLDRLLAALGNTAGVSRVEYVDRDEALARFGRWFPDLAKVSEDLDDNPLPASIEVYLAGRVGGGEVARTLRERFGGADGVDEIRFDVDWIDRVESLLALARAGGTVVGLATFGVVVFVIASVLRLAVYARRDEIEIMMLVGATPAFVRGPFLFAGVVQGVVASAVALGAVDALRRVLLSYGAREAVALPVLLFGRGLGGPAVASICGLGVFVSLLGAWLAVRSDLGNRLLR
jgi:cell division transport system permease protein